MKLASFSFVQGGNIAFPLSSVYNLAQHGVMLVIGTIVGTDEKVPYSFKFDREEDAQEAYATLIQHIAGVRTADIVIIDGVVDYD